MLKKRLAKHWDEYQVNYYVAAYSLGAHMLFYIFFGIF